MVHQLVATPDPAKSRPRISVNTRLVRAEALASPAIAAVMEWTLVLVSRSPWSCASGSGPTWRDLVWCVMALQSVSGDVVVVASGSGPIRTDHARPRPWWRAGRTCPTWCMPWLPTRAGVAGHRGPLRRRRVDWAMDGDGPLCEPCGAGGVRDSPHSCSYGR